MADQPNTAAGQVGRVYYQDARPSRTTGGGRAKHTYYSAKGSKAGQEITQGAYMVELERYCNRLERDQLNRLNPKEGKLNQKYNEGRRAGRMQKGKEMDKLKGKMKAKVDELKEEITKLKVMAKAVLKKEDKQTVYRKKADKKGVMRRSSFWKDRSKLLRDVGTNIHGGSEGYELDIRHQVARNQTTIDAFLRIDKVQERSAVIAICFLYLSISSTSNTHYTFPTQAKYDCRT